MPSSPCGRKAYSLRIEVETLLLLRTERCDILNKRDLVRNSKRKVNTMKYPFMTLDDQTEIVHSEMHEDGTVEVYIEKPDEKDCFHSVSCYLPKYEWKNNCGFTQKELDRYQEVIQSTAHLIMEFSQSGGLENAAGF